MLNRKLFGGSLAIPTKIPKMQPKGVFDANDARSDSTSLSFGPSWPRRIKTAVAAGLVLSAALFTAPLFFSDTSGQLSHVISHGGNGVGLFGQAIAQEDAQARLIRENKYSIIISTYNRYETFRYLLDHYGTEDMPRLDAIFINWALGAVEPPESLSLNLTSYRVPVYLRQATEHSLGERFKPFSQMRTDAALWLDDDMRLGGSTVEFMFSAWKSVGQRDHRIVGRVGRLSTRNQEGLLTYSPGAPQKYNLMLTGIAFMDRTMASWYWEDDPALNEGRRLVDEGTNCEDLLMNFIVARKTGLAPFLAHVPGDVRHIMVSSGISSDPGHVNRRSLCLQKFESLFGNVLVENDVAMIQASSVGDFGQDSMRLPNQWKPQGLPWGDGKVFVPGKIKEDRV